MAKQNFGNWLLFILLSLVWGSSFILMKKTSQDLTGWQIGSVRIFAAGLFFLPLAVFHIAKIPLRKLPVIILSGVLGNLIPAFLFAIAIEKRIDSALAGILNSLTPLCVIIVGVLFFKIKVQNKRIAGVLVGFVGLFILSLSRGPVTGSELGFTLLIFLATILYGFNINMVSQYLKEIAAIKIAAISMAFIGIPAAIIAWQQNIFSLVKYDETARQSIGIITLLGITGSALSTAFFYLLIKRAGGLFASLITYAIPIVAIFWGIMANEHVTVIEIGCLALILVGVYLANK